MKNFNGIVDQNIFDQQFEDSFMNRSLDQKFLYFWEWAELYYDEKNADNIYWTYVISEKVLKNLVIESVFCNNKKWLNSFVSLWCGNSKNEKIVFDYISNLKCNIEYCWVDSSKEMLLMSKNVMKKSFVDSKFIYADFYSRDFKNEIKRLSYGDKNRIYTMFWNIFGNLNPTKIINVLNNILRKWDKLWIDVRLKIWSSVWDDLKLFDNYCNYLKSPKDLKFFKNIFWNLWIPDENIDLYVSTFNDKVLGSLRFDFNINFKKKTIINVWWDKIIILPDENMKIVHIYAYDYYKLIEFFSENWFKMKKMHKYDGRGHFVFEKI